MSNSGMGRPILRLAVGAADVSDDQRLQKALEEIAAEKHPSGIINTHPRDRKYSLEGTTESELDSICDRLRDEYHLAIIVGAPTAILLETVRKRAEAEGKYIRQVGGSGNYGHCKLRIEPAEAGAGYEFINEIRGGAIPNEYIKPIEAGIIAAMGSGIVAGAPLTDVRVTLFDGSYHESDSNEMAFEFASSIAFREAAKKAIPVLLEPMMSIEMEVFEGFVQAVRSEVAAHRGRIERDELTATGLIEIKAIIPLSELLASASEGLAAFPMDFAGYEPVRDSHSPDDGTAGVTANKPNRPRLGSGFEMARRDPDED